ncbi:SDR family NAD(P)-dependent oxidoreductase [Pseudocolwellia agarivorans]|uniref:SDR family NAD(P)-dependent oxidoreductase n=1 Tax=Pseudocolwellia agarivorans TaxID=1911682 RepID=UPI00098557FC|nr:SDR family oxidoreductase [Pseudocolwellia agarivorans]
MSFDKNLFTNKKILIAGAGKGIGLACAAMAAEYGADVIAVARTESDLDKLVARYPERITPWVMDVTSEDFYQKLRELPTLDGLVNNAGINRVGPMEAQSSENIDAVIDLNIRTLYKISQAAITPMKRSEAASIVNMSSQMGFVGSQGRTLYCMSKHAVEGVTKAMAVELADHNIRVNTVAPTFVLTPMTEPMFEDEAFKSFVFNMIPLGRLAKVEDIANSCTFLLSDLASMITGTSIKVDGGWTAR